MKKHDLGMEYKNIKYIRNIYRKRMIHTYDGIDAHKNIIDVVSRR